MARLAVVLKVGHIVEIIDSSADGPFVMDVALSSSQANTTLFASEIGPNSN
jgi:hypothetical protein